MKLEPSYQESIKLKLMSRCIWCQVQSAVVELNKHLLPQVRIISSSQGLGKTFHFLIFKITLNHRKKSNINTLPTKKGLKGWKSKLPNKNQIYTKDQNKSVGFLLLQISSMEPPFKIIILNILKWMFYPQFRDKEDSEKLGKLSHATETRSIWQQTPSSSL